MKSTGAWFSNELQWLYLMIGCQDSSPSDGHQGDMPYWLLCIIKNSPLIWQNPYIESGPYGYFNGLVKDCSNSIADALELLQSCTKPSIISHCVWSLKLGNISLICINGCQYWGCVIYLCNDKIVSYIDIDLGIILAMGSANERRR